MSVRYSSPMCPAYKDTVLVNDDNQSYLPSTFSVTRAHPSLFLYPAPRVTCQTLAFGSQGSFRAQSLPRYGRCILLLIPSWLQVRIFVSSIHSRAGVRSKKRYLMDSVMCRPGKLPLRNLVSFSSLSYVKRAMRWASMDEDWGFGP